MIRSRTSRFVAAAVLSPLLLVTAACSGGDKKSDNNAATGDSPAVTASSEPIVSNDADLATTPLDPNAQPTSALGAVQAFIAAEMKNDFARSYALLDTQTRTTLTEAEWNVKHVELPVFEEIGIAGERPSADVPRGMQVDGIAQLKSSLDEINGLVPARAKVSVVAVPEGAEWRVDPNQTFVEPIYPSDATAPAAVAKWVKARQDGAGCPGAKPADAALEYSSLVGAPAIAEPLCKKAGDVKTGGVVKLARLPNPAPVINAFGSDSGEWARVVQLDAPLELQIVVAPVNDQWLVIGVAPHDLAAA